MVQKEKDLLMILRILGNCVINVFPLTMFNLIGMTSLPIPHSRKAVRCKDISRDI